MIKVKSNNVNRTLAESHDVATWPVETTGRSFKPGTFYSLGTLTTPLTYTLIDGSESSQWGFSFVTGDEEVVINHPSDVDYTDFKKAPAHSRVEIFAIQDGGKKYITHVIYPVERTVHVKNGEIQDTEEEFLRMVDQGKERSLYKVGDSITIKLNGRVSIVLQIAGFATDELATSTDKCKVAFLAKTLIGAPLPFYKDRFNHNTASTGTNRYEYASWSDADTGYIRDFLEEFLFPALPEAFRRRIVPVKKTQLGFVRDGTSAVSQTSYDYVWIPDKVELSGTGKYSGLFTVVNQRIRRTADGAAQNYLLRSAATKSTVDMITTTGADGTTSINDKQYICFGFCI